MSSEVTRFLLARSPQRVCTEDPLRPPLRLADWLDGSDLLVTLEGEEPAARLAIAAEYLALRLSRPVTSVAEFDTPWAAELALLDEWLRCRGNLPDVDDTRELVKRLFRATKTRKILPRTSLGSPPNDTLRDAGRLLAELLVAASHSATPPTTQRNLVRAVLVLALVELLLTSSDIITSSEDILWALRDRMVLLPGALFPLPSRSGLARRPGFADLYVVRQEWNRYVAGEIAHIENVLPGEFKERVHTRTDEAETTITTATETSRLQELDVQSTSRFELDQEAQTDTTLAAHVEGQVDTSGMYGPTKVDTHLGGSLDYSKEESERHATQQATETTARALNRVEERVREERIVRTLMRIEEKNTHRIDNDGGGPVAGVYRWVDKFIRLQTYRYPNRYLLEFEVPEPAAYVRWLEHQRGDQGFQTSVPTPFTTDGLPETDQNPRLLATDISEDPEDPGYYLGLAARWHAIGVLPPPPAEVTVSGWLHIPSDDPEEDKTSHDVWITPPEVAASGTGEAGGVEGESIKVPDGYEAEDRWDGWLATWDQDDAVRPGWNPGGPEESYVEAAPGAVVTIGDSQNDPADLDPETRNIVIPLGQRGWTSIPIGGELSGRRTGTLPITVLSGNFGMMSIQARVKCLRQDGGALLTWQVATYETLRAAYFELLRAHEEERAARAVRAGVEIEGRSPLENARVVREELKRQVVELLIGEPFFGFEDLQFDVDARPRTLIQSTLDHAPLIQFLEQVFEWENLTYIVYPYFWTSENRWDELQGIQSPDPDYARFLRAGSARVVLAARPGFDVAVDFFMATGLPWTGGPAPIPEDPEYISVAAEIQAQTGAPADGEPVDSSWELRLPTTLVCLDPDPTLPKVNDDAVLPAPAPA